MYGYSRTPTTERGPRSRHQASSCQDLKKARTNNRADCARERRTVNCSNENPTLHRSSPDCLAAIASTHLHAPPFCCQGNHTSALHPATTKENDKQEHFSLLSSPTSEWVTPYSVALTIELLVVSYPEVCTCIFPFLPSVDGVRVNAANVRSATRGRLGC